MTDLITSWVVNALALLATSFIMPGFHLPSSYSAVIGALWLGITNYSIKPIMSFCSTPVNMLSLGAFAWVIDAVTLVVVSWFTPGMAIDTYLDALLGSVLYYLINRGMYAGLDTLRGQGQSRPSKFHDE